MWELQNLDLPLAEFLHLFPALVFAGHLGFFVLAMLFLLSVDFCSLIIAIFVPMKMGDLIPPHSLVVVAPREGGLRSARAIPHYCISC